MEEPAPKLTLSVSNALFFHQVVIIASLLDHELEN